MRDPKNWYSPPSCRRGCHQRRASDRPPVFRRSRSAATLRIRGAWRTSGTPREVEPVDDARAIRPAPLRHADERDVPPGVRRHLQQAAAWEVAIRAELGPVGNS